MTASQRTNGLEQALDPDGEVVVFIPAGSVDIVGTDDSVVRATARGERSLTEILDVAASERRISLQPRDGGLQVGPLRIGFGGTADVRMEVPRTARVEVRTASADISSNGLRGAQQYSTGSGELRLRVDGGDVAIDAVSGDVDVRSSAPLGLAVRSVSGDVDVEAPTVDELRVSTTSGDVAVDAELGQAGAHRIETISGDVTLTTGTELAVDATTVSGDIEADGRRSGGLGKRTVALGTGTTRLTFSSMSGDLRVRRREAPRSPETERAGAAAPLASEDARPDAVADPAEKARLWVLQALERGDIDVTEALRRIDAIEPSGSSDDASGRPMPPLRYAPRELAAPFDRAGIA